MILTLLVPALFIGFGATLVTDLWMVIRQCLFASPFPDFGLVGRWVGHMSHGQFSHDKIQTSPKVKGETPLGWLIHYSVGILFAAIHVGLFGEAWVLAPTIGPALMLGLVTVAAPFLLMQPGMGAGIAGSRTPHPGSSRIQSLVTHGFFGLGLYLSALVLALMR